MVLGPLILLVSMLFWGIFNLILKYFQFQFCLLIGFGLVGSLYINLYNYLDYLNITQMKRQNFILFLMWYLSVKIEYICRSVFLEFSVTPISKLKNEITTTKNLINVSITNIVFILFLPSLKKASCHQIIFWNWMNTELKGLMINFLDNC